MTEDELKTLVRSAVKQTEDEIKQKERLGWMKHPLMVMAGSLLMSWAVWSLNAYAAPERERISKVETRVDNLETKFKEFMSQGPRFTKEDAKDMEDRLSKQIDRVAEMNEGRR